MYNAVKMCSFVCAMLQIFPLPITRSHHGTPSQAYYALRMIVTVQICIDVFVCMCGVSGYIYYINLNFHIYTYVSLNGNVNTIV